MKFKEYQEKAMTTCMSSCNNLSYMLLNLVGEVGEFSSKIAKAIRKDKAKFDKDNDICFTDYEVFDLLNEELRKEAGDILWQLSGICSVMGWDLSEVAKDNLIKLASRQRRGVIDGNGDNR